MGCRCGRRRPCSPPAVRGRTRRPTWPAESLWRWTESVEPGVVCRDASWPCRCPRVGRRAAVDRMRRRCGPGGRQASAARLPPCSRDLNVTGVPAGTTDPAELGVPGRPGWRSGLLFKRWKGDGGPGRPGDSRPHWVLCQVNEAATVVALGPARRRDRTRSGRRGAAIRTRGQGCDDLPTTGFVKPARARRRLCR